MKPALVRMAIKHQSTKFKHKDMDVDIEANSVKDEASIIDTEVTMETITISIEAAKEDIITTTEATMGNLIDLSTWTPEETSYGILMGNQST